jgi:hypothetical protein
MRINIQSKTLMLAANANVSYESAEEWYGCYGAHITRDDERGDIEVQAVEYGWLDDGNTTDTYRTEALAALTGPAEDNADRFSEINRWAERADSYAAAKIKEWDCSLTWGEIESLVDLAQRTREAADSLAEELDAAATAYTDGDFGGVIEHLQAARNIETDHGDDPATNTLAAQLLVDMEDMEITGTIHWEGEDDARNAYLLVEIDGQTPTELIYGNDGQWDYHSLCQYGRPDNDALKDFLRDWANEKFAEAPVEETA